MAKRRSRRSGNMLFDWIWMIVGLLVAIGVGGLFATGGTLTFPILNWFPLIVHQIVGWVVIIGAILGFGMKVVNG